ncbi:MAG: tetratricopeptide repeat protein [Anaerolineales bacterium]
MKTKLTLLLGLILALAACNIPWPAPQAEEILPPQQPLPTASQTPTPPLPASTSSDPTATPFPTLRVSSGEKAIFLGDYARARDEFRLSRGSNDPDTRAAALWGLGKTEFLAQNHRAALDNLRALTQNHSNHELAAYGWFLLGETYFILERYDESERAYQNYLNLRPGLLDHYTQTRRGNALRASGKPLEAIEAYQAAIEAGTNDPIPLQLQIAQAYTASGNPQTALILYDEIEAATNNDYVKAQVYLLAGQAYMRMGDSASAYEKWQFTVNNYPLAYDSYSALVGLVNAGVPVNEYNRGLINYFVGQYPLALAAFDRYILADPSHDGSVLHYKALTLRELGQHTEAIAVWDEFIRAYPANRFWATAWEQKGFTQWAYLNDHAEGAKTFEDFVSFVPGSPFAVSYLMNAARINERGGNLERAAEVWEMVALQYSSDPEASNALFLAGIAHYRRGDFERAQDNFQRAQILAVEDIERTRAQFWVGKAMKVQGDTQGAVIAWQSAQAIMPNGYYSLRARDMLLNREPFVSLTTYNFEYNLASERHEAISWMRVRFDLPPETDLSGPGELSNDPRFQRGLEFWQMGLQDQARLEFEELRLSILDDPLASFRLGNYLLDMGMYRPAITALRQVLTLAGLTDQTASLSAPAYFNYARYGLYYQELIFTAAEDYNFDPLFVTSLIRQESLFEGFARSSAGARGLMQIMPATGADVANQMGWPPEYNNEMLYNPQTSVRMGTYYLNNTRRFVGGNLYATLAGYNAGPGNAAIWKNLAGDDSDLLLEIIRFQETRNYIRGIYEIYNVYRSLYSPLEQ